MSIKRDEKARRRAPRRRDIAMESLERRALLTTVTETFTAPSLGNLITQTEAGKSPSAAIDKMLTSLESQFKAGPLADLKAGKVGGNGFIVESQQLEASYEQDVDRLFSAVPKVDELLKLQGQRVVGDLVGLNQQFTVGLISQSGFVKSASTEVASIAGGPINSLGTSQATMATLSIDFANELQSLSKGLDRSSISLTQLGTTLQAESEAYRAEVHAALQVPHRHISSFTDDAINTLQDAVARIVANNPTDATGQLNAAFGNFNETVLGTSGLYASGGLYSQVLKLTGVPYKNTQVASTLTSVTGTSTSNGVATLTATLTSTGSVPLAGQRVGFTLDGAFAGLGTTDSGGVATVTNVATSDPLGTDTGGVVVYYAGTIESLSAQGTGNLSVTTVTSATTLGAVSGTATFGATASLTATLSSSSTGQGIAGKTVNFTLDGTSVGSAVTGTTGIATLVGVPNAVAAGTDTGGVVATFAGDASNNAASATGNLVVSRASTTLVAVSGASSPGGSATLTAGLTSSATNLGIAGQTVSFTLDGTSVGSAITNSNGIATLAGVATTDTLGTDTGGVVASFAGSTNYSAAANAAGNLVVSTTNTILTSVSGSAAFGGPATLMASLFSESTSAPLSGKTINFTLDGTTVGSGVTNSSGVATLTGVATNAVVGTDSNLIASFAGDAGDAAANSVTGNLVVSQAGTALSNVSGVVSFGGTATLSATLKSSVTNAAVAAGQMVTFVLDGTTVGTGVTNASGVATLADVATTDTGTDAGGVVASFAGSANYAAAANASGNLTVSAASTTTLDVSGTATYGGTANLTATLESTSTSLGLAGQTIRFTLDGKVVGTAVTNASGVATLADAATSQVAGTDTGGIVANFAGTANYALSQGVGNLVTSPAGTAFSAVSGTATFGGTATLTATLDSTVTKAGANGEVVTFTLDGKSVGTAITDTVGVATLTGVPTTDAAGTIAGGIVVSFAGGTNYTAAADATGDLVVSKAGTAITAVSGTASFGGPATLVATLTSTTTTKPIAGQTVSFTLDGTLAGTALTDSSGVATLAGVANSDATGTDTGGIVATLASTADYEGTSGTGNLVVTQTGTAITAVSGTASLGGNATLTATLTSSATNSGTAGQVISFTLGGSPVGTAVTDSNGVATLTGVNVSDFGVGTDLGGVVATFMGGTNYGPSTGTGDLVVSPAPTAVTDVSGTATYGGTATLMATLASTVNNGKLAGQTVTFSLDGMVVGTAVTNASGVATLAGVPITVPAGNDAGNVEASFASTSDYQSSSATGDLVVSKDTTNITAVAGAVAYGGTATLTATLGSVTTGQGIANETVTFTLNGTVVGSAPTNASGVATLTGLAITDPAGTTEDITANFDGDPNLNASQGTGNFAVSQANTSVTAVSGTAPAGGPATLMATVTSLVTGQPIAGEVVDFTLDGVVVGAATTDNNGVATLPDVATSDPAGTDSGGVVATFPGDTNYETSNGTGDLTVTGGA